MCSGTTSGSSWTSVSIKGISSCRKSLSYIKLWFYFLICLSHSSLCSPPSLFHHNLMTLNVQGRRSICVRATHGALVLTHTHTAPRGEVVLHHKVNITGKIFSVYSRPSSRTDWSTMMRGDRCYLGFSQSKLEHCHKSTSLIAQQILGGVSSCVCGVIFSFLIARACLLFREWGLTAPWEQVQTCFMCWIGWSNVILSISTEMRRQSLAAVLQLYVIVLHMTGREVGNFTLCVRVVNIRRWWRVSLYHIDGRKKPQRCLFVVRWILCPWGNHCHVFQAWCISLVSLWVLFRILRHLKHNRLIHAF